jgi:5'(3')-deoxyribonucleotidase
LKKILYCDLDGVLTDFSSAFPFFSADTLKAFENHLDEIPGVFSKMSPVIGAVDAFATLSQRFDTYILSTAPWNNPSAWSDKLEWVKTNLGNAAYKRLILTHHKNLNKGDFLVDDRQKNGASEFAGELILFGSEQFPDWSMVTKYLLSKL